MFAKSMLPPDTSTEKASASEAGALGRLLGAGTLTAVLAIAAAGLTMLPRPGRPVAILSSGSKGLVMAIGEAGGTVLAAPSSHVTIAMPGDEAFVSRLRQLGYVLVLDADAVAGCGMFNSVNGKSDAE